MSLNMVQDCIEPVLNQVASHPGPHTSGGAPVFRSWSRENPKQCQCPHTRSIKRLQHFTRQRGQDLNSLPMQVQSHTITHCLHNNFTMGNSPSPHRVASQQRGGTCWVDLPTNFGRPRRSSPGCSPAPWQSLDISRSLKRPKKVDARLQSGHTTTDLQHPLSNNHPMKTYDHTLQLKIAGNRLNLRVRYAGRGCTGAGSQLS